MNRRREILANILVPLGSVALTLVAVEVALRFVGPLPRYEMREYTLELDRDVLFRLVEDPEAQVNDAGYHDHEFPADSGDRRVLVIGDSFVMGYNTDVEYTLPRILGRRLGAGWEVRNHGVYGYGPDQAYLRLRDEGLVLDPRHVVLVLFPANDFDDLYKNGLVDPAAERLTFRRDHPVSRALEGSRLVALGRKLLTGSTLPAAREQELFFRLFIDKFDLLADRDDPATAAKIAAMRLVLRGFHELLEPRGTQLLVVIVPSYEATVDPTWFEEREIPRELWFANEDLAVETCADAGVELLDLRELIAPEQWPSLFDPNDRHFSVKGNEVVAGILADKITRSSQ